MPRPLWAGAISFGLVTIPVKIVSATEDHDVHFHRVHLADMGRVRTRKVCELDDQVVSQDEIGKGYEITKDQTVTVTDEELEQMPLPTAKAIEIAAFVDADTIDPVGISDSYYLAADGPVAAKPYTLLRKALERSSKVAVAKFAWHGRERLGLLRIREGAIVLHSMKWPDEVRSTTDVAVPREVEVAEEEIEQALQLAEQMTIEDLSGFHDEYREALEDIIAAKAEGKPLPSPAEDGKAEKGEVVDLMAALNASVKAAEESRGERGEDATVHEMRPSKKSTAKKTATSKSSAAKKTTSKKTAGKKAASKRRSAS
ncbi:Ku protein [Streptomyces sp. MBT67]|uniref:non-homologous end joining protein Ku n=1 Tax=unclassified Streptomyces TaxID=2593676 RepID=UPI00190B54BC|nr:MULTISPECIES: Ku protein [unclassified Streptomyces]MBK3529817.1 Ku protein [Streptomyces sp. MBT72]MBK3540053.1 Ku protein [Streptomyces sp. MBT67]MBK3554611.1 Ku protein [Streptomyces sp. MBT61]MBK6032797.1 Ku protein [Streptomyces sp. MBT59]